MFAGILFAPASAIVNAPPPVAAGVTAPASVGVPHSCPESQYPVSALQAGVEGKSVMKFTITTEGRAANISVQTSSGNVDLDAAAVACAANWLYRPATQNGLPVTVPWVTAVNWKIGTDEPYSILATLAKACIEADPAGLEEMKTAPLRTVVRLRFAGGAMTDIVVAGSSGVSDLDDRALTCYRGLASQVTMHVPDGETLLVMMKPNE